MDKQTASIIKEKEELKIDNEKLKERIMQLEEQSDLQALELQKSIKDLEKVRREFSLSLQMHENEVSLRLQFEKKLSNITAM